MASNWQFVFFDNATVNIWQHTCAFTTHRIRHLVVLLWICKYKQGRGLLIIAKDTLYYNEFRKEKIDFFSNQLHEGYVRVQIKYGKVYKVGQDFVGFFFSIWLHIYFIVEKWIMTYVLQVEKWMTFTTLFY